MNEKRFTMSELKTLTYLRDKTDNNRRKYDLNKKVTLMKVTDAFIDYVTIINLTRSEYLLVQNVYDNVINKLNGNDEND